MSVAADLEGLAGAIGKAPSDSWDARVIRRRALAASWVRLALPGPTAAMRPRGARNHAPAGRPAAPRVRADALRSGRSRPRNPLVHSGPAVRISGGDARTSSRAAPTGKGSPMTKRTVASVLAALFLGGGCEASGGGGADVIQWVSEPIACADGEACTLEEATPDGCRLTSIADCAPDFVAQVCCELPHPGGALVRLAWTWRSCVAADGTPYVPAECIGVATAEPVCCAFDRSGGAALLQVTGHGDCSDRGGSEVAAAECESAAAPVCCTSPAELEGYPDRTLIAPLSDCMALAGVAGPADDTCHPACERPCDGRGCGIDCGFTCGECDDDLVCTAIGTCELTAEAGETVCCERSDPAGTPRERRLALRPDCLATGGAALDVGECGEALPQPAAADVCCEWPAEGAACADDEDCTGGVCVDTAFGGLCGAGCRHDHDCPVGRQCRFIRGNLDGPEDACRPAALWWPAPDCAATGGEVVVTELCE
jgi:hypothetical protein